MRGTFEFVAINLLLLMNSFYMFWKTWTSKLSFRRRELVLKVKIKHLEKELLISVHGSCDLLTRAVFVYGKKKDKFYFFFLKQLESIWWDIDITFLKFFTLQKLALELAWFFIAVKSLQGNFSNLIIYHNKVSSLTTAQSNTLEEAVDDNFIQ